MFCPKCGNSAGEDAAFCQKCGTSLKVQVQSSGGAVPSGSLVAEDPASPVKPTGTQFAQKKTKSEFAGTGCVIQAIGLVLLFLFPIGTIVGIILLVYGSMKSVKRVCSRCGNTVESSSKICPHCKSVFN